ncbi:MAG: hypothetical protein LRY35_04815 [Clostridiales bacterium]|mgnify:CR=1 FL=1|nr:hypothetical protein [Clostridiales bacterium]
MTLLTGMFFAGLALLALVTYLVLVHLQQAEMQAYRQLAQVYREAHFEQGVTSADFRLRDPSGFFVVGLAATAAPYDMDTLAHSQNPESLPIRQCA